MKKEINLGQFKKLNFYYVKITSSNKHQLLSVHYDIITYKQEYGKFILKDNVLYKS